MTFPHPTLTPIVGKPTPQTLQRLKKELVANAMSVPSTRGGGLHGHLALVIPNAEYFILTGNVFDVPVHPGQPPVHPNAATNAQIHSADTAYARAITDVKDYIETRNNLRTLLLDAVPENYYNVLSDPTFGYATVTPLELMQHLHASYGTITAKDLQKNRNALTSPWNPDDDITTLWTRVRECQLFARASPEPISDDTAMLLILEALTASGVMHVYINEWQRRDSTAQSYKEFQTHFERANKVRIEELTAATAGYHTTNLLVPPPGIAPAANAAATPGPAPAPPSDGVRIDNLTTMFYCWTHGLGRSSLHTSRTCEHPAPNHVHTATILDMQGGSQHITLPGGRSRNRPARRTN